MKIPYLIPNRFGKYNIKAPPSRSNPSGGVSTKAQRVIEALSTYYEIVPTEKLPDDADVIVVEPLWFKYRGHVKLQSSERYTQDAIEQYQNHPASIKILYSTELTLLELPAVQRHQICEASTIVTTPCRWLEERYNMQGIVNQRLCDPIPDLFYAPTATKECSVVAMGRISTDKNSEKIIEIYKALEGKNIKRIYIGSANLWGESNARDTKLERELRKHTDEFHHNVAQPELARILARAGCGIFDTFHDTGSECNLEAATAGVVAVYGDHGLWDERPGIRRLRTVAEFVAALGHLTMGFSAPPPEVDRDATEAWARANCSYDQFLKEWRIVLDNARSQS